MPWRQRLPPILLVGVVLLLAFGAFLLCQKPYVATGGGATDPLSRCLSAISAFKSTRRTTKGGGVVNVLALGGIGALCVLVLLPKWLRPGKEKPPVTGLPAKDLLALAALALALPAMLFWLINPTPAQHLILSLVGLSLFSGCVAPTGSAALQGRCGSQCCWLREIRLR